jgi:methylase of polypeptide subunit release factors
MHLTQHALIAIGQKLRALAYRFVAVTPTTHRIVYDRAEVNGPLQAVFGWNRRFALEDIGSDFVELLHHASALVPCDDGFRSAVRFASIDDLVFAHSGFPTLEHDSVFFGPDTYRFVRLLRFALGDLAGMSGLRVVDVGCGSGAGGLCAAKLLGAETEITLADINPNALYFGAVNAAINGITASIALSDVLQGVQGQADLIIANPPYLVDVDQRLYRHGGGELGIEIAGRIVEQALARLAKNGRLVLYTGTPIVAGADRFFQLVRPLLQLHAQHFVYEEIDPDVFGEELMRPAYAKADRIAAVGLNVLK